MGKNKTPPPPTPPQLRRVGCKKQMEILSTIFGGAERVKIMRLFLYNPNIFYDRKEISERTKVDEEKVSEIVSVFSKIAFIKKKKIVKEIEIIKETKKIKGKKKSGEKKPEPEKILVKRKMDVWTINNNFPYLIPLQTFLINPDLIRHDSILKKIVSAGKIKLLILSGIFIQDATSRVDMLIVGDQIKKNSLEKILKNIEAELGKEIRFAAFETPDFTYRMGLYDKLLRDIFEYPHEKVLDKLGIK